MSNTIPVEYVKATFRQEMATALRISPGLTVAKALRIIRAFYQGYAIAEMDTSSPDCDMLLVEYGIYDWHDGKGKQFQFDFTRQFLFKEEQEFYQLRLELSYGEAPFALPESFSAWSTDFASLDEWVSKIKASPGFQQTPAVAPHTFLIYFDLT